MTSPPVPPQAAEAAASAIAEALYEAWGGVLAGDGAERLARTALEAAAPHLTGELAAQLEHAKAALAGGDEGIRLWMLDCGELVERHRKHADEAAAAERERCAQHPHLLRAISDPGSVVSRDKVSTVNGTELESLPHWQMRAVAALLREAQP